MKAKHVIAEMFLAALSFGVFAAPQSNIAKDAIKPSPPMKAPLVGWQVWHSTGERILPDTKPPRGSTNAIIGIVGAADAVATASFAIHALQPVAGLTLSPGAIKNENGKELPPGAIDISLVKCWYQDPNGWHSMERGIGQSVLVPELLLHDDELVKTDAENRLNLVRRPDGTYRKIGAAENGLLEDFVAGDDAEKLLPFDIAKDETRQIFIEAAIPKGTEPGLYSGSILLGGKDGASYGHVRFKMRIIEAELGNATSRFTSWEDLDGTRIPSGSSPAITKTGPQAFDAVTLLPDSLATKKNFDFLRKYSFVPAITPNSLDRFGELFPEKPSRLWIAPYGAFDSLPAGEPDGQSVIDTAKKAARLQVEDTRLFIPSRIEGDGLAKDKAIMEAVDNLGIKTWAPSTIATYEEAADVLTAPFEYGLPRDKNVVRLPEINGDPYGGMELTDSRLVEMWHAIGTPMQLVVKIPAGIENPSLWRRAAGIEAFFVGYDGIAIPELVEDGDPWNDFAPSRARSKTFLYPTKNGFVKTLAWQGLAEGVADARYLSKVRRLASSLRYPKPADYRVDIEARKATMWIQWIYYRQADLDQIRLDAIAWIEKLDAIRTEEGR